MFFWRQGGKYDSVMLNFKFVYAGGIWSRTQVNGDCWGEGREIVNGAFLAEKKKNRELKRHKCKFCSFLEGGGWDYGSEIAQTDTK